MKQTIEIEVPEGFEAKYNPKENKIELIKKDNKPKTWEEFCDNYPVKAGEAFISSINHPNIIVTSNWAHGRTKDICTSEKEAEAFLALIQLRQLRKAWVGDWEPEWNGVETIYIVQNYGNRIECVPAYRCVRPINFPNAEMAIKFIECFKDLLEQAKILL